MTLNITPIVAGTITAKDIPFQLDVEMGDFIIGGMLVSTNSSQSTAVSISSGSTVFQGFLIDEDVTGSLNVATSATNFVFVVITKNASSKPTSVAYVASTAETQSNGLRIAKVISTTKVSSVDVGLFGAAMIPFNTIQFAYGQLGAAIP